MPLVYQHHTELLHQIVHWMNIGNNAAVCLEQVTQTNTPPPKLTVWFLRLWFVNKKFINWSIKYRLIFSKCWFHSWLIFMHTFFTNMETHLWPVVKNVQIPLSLDMHKHQLVLKPICSTGFLAIQLCLRLLTTKFYPDISSLTSPDSRGRRIRYFKKYNKEVVITQFL